MRSIKYAFMACAVAALAGCQTADETYYDAQGRPGMYDDEYGGDPVVEGLNRGVNTNYFGPVNSGPEAARGPGTPSGTFDDRRP